MSSSSSSSSTTSGSSSSGQVNKNVSANQRNNFNQMSAITTIPDETLESLNKWLTTIYDTSDITESIIKEMWEMFSYKGFNRVDVLKQMHALCKDNKKMFVELVIVTALRGPQAASIIKLSNGKTPREMNIPASGGQGNKSLTLNKIQAATADLAAYFLKKMNAPKKLNMDLPGWLQFPSAGGIKLPSNYRIAHIEFSKKFSNMIGGQFREEIYMQMENNAYMDDRLKLFD
jgi:hypothetical protein